LYKISGEFLIKPEVNGNPVVKISSHKIYLHDAIWLSLKRQISGLNITE